MVKGNGTQEDLISRLKEQGSILIATSKLTEAEVWRHVRKHDFEQTLQIA